MSTVVQPATVPVARERVRRGEEPEGRSRCSGDVAGFVPSAGPGDESR